MSALKKLVCALVLVVAAIAGLVVPAQAAVRPHEANAMHRLYNPNSGEHFYTASVGERDATVAAGWLYEGVGWYAPKSGTDVYRLYNPNAGDHHYTVNAAERDVMVEKGWHYEGVGWLSDVGEEVAVWRQYNPNAVAGAHNFTTSKFEHISLCKIGWRGEGIGWYGVTVTHTASLEIGETEASFATGEPISRDTIMDMLDVRAWVDDIRQTDLSGLKVDDGGLSDAAANNEVGRYTVTLTLDVPASGGAEGTTVTKTIDVVLDGPCEITYAVASNLATSSGGTTHPGTERIASRLFTTEAQGAYASAASGFSLDGWYAEKIINGSEPTTERLGTGSTYKPTVDGAWPAQLLFTAYLRADTSTPYTVNHHLQRLNAEGTDVVGTSHTDACFDLDETDSETGTTGLMTQAKATGYYGFTPEHFEQQVVAGDGSTVIDIYYLRDTFTAVYDANGHGTVPEPAQVPFDALIPQPDDSEVSAVGYNINGWSHDTDGEEACDFTADTVSTPVTTIYADWASKTYNVTLDHANGTGATETVQVGYGQTPDKVDVPLYHPYIFCGYWRAFPDGTSQQFTDNEGTWLTPWNLDEDGVTLVAMWATPGDAPYTVRHWMQQLNEDETAVAGTDKTITYEEVEGEIVPVCADYAQETGGQETLKSMVGTMTAAQAHAITGFSVCPFAQKEIEAGGTTVIDIFYDRNTYTANFDANGHGTPPVPQTVPYGALLAPVAPGPVTGYEFLGWSVDKSDTYWNFAEDDMGAEDLRLYAMWQSVHLTDWSTIGQMMAEGTPSIMVGDTEVFFGDLPSYDGGSWKVSTPEQLAYVGYLTGAGALPAGTTADITLTASVDMTGDQYCTGDMERLNWTPIAGFAGTFDGAGKTISGMSAECEGPAGLIGYLSGNTKVTNLVLEAPHASSTGEAAGAVVGSTNVHDLEVTGVYLRGADIDGATYAGAYVGCANGGTCKLMQSSAHESGISGTYTGGLVGGSTSEASLELFDCVSANSYVEGTGVAGGALGWVAGAASVERVGAQLGTVCVLGGAGEGDPSVGGLVGRLTDEDPGEAPTFANVYATGTLEGIERAAGLVCADDGMVCAIRNSYAATPTTIESGIYALATGNPQMQVCYYDSDLCKDAPEATAEGVNPRGTQVMKRTSTAFYLNGSRFGEPWTITDGSNDGYPVFGLLADTSPYTVSFDYANPKASGGTSSQEVRYGRISDAITPPSAPGFTFMGYYSDYDGEGTKYVDEHGAWVRAWDQPEGATLYAMWEGNIITYVWPLSWLNSVPAKTLANGGWTIYGENEAKALPMDIVPPTAAVTLAGWDISGDGIPAEANKTCVTSLPEGTYGRVRATAHYVLGPATTWDQTYLPMRDQVDGYPPLPSYDADKGGWQVTNNVELAFVMGANTRGEMNRVRSYEEINLAEEEPGGLGSFASVSPKSANAVLTADIDLTGDEVFTTSLDTQVGWGGTDANPLLWVPTTTYRAEFDGQAHSITTCKIRNTYNSMTAGSRFGEGFYAQANATGFFRRLDSGANVHSFMLLSPDVYARNNAGGGRTAFSTTGAVAGLVEGNAKVHAVGVEDGSVTIYHVKNMHNERVAGLVGTLRGTATIEDCYVRGTLMTSDVRNHNWRCQISQQAGICVASQAGATVRDTYYRGSMSIGARSKRNTVAYQSGAIVPRKNLSGSNGSVPGSGATISNCYVDTASSFPGGRVDNAVARKFSTELKGRAFAFTLNNRGFGAPWNYVETRNQGYPIIGYLENFSPYTVNLDAQGGTHGSGGATAAATYGEKPAAVVRPSRANYVFAGYYTQPNGKGTQYVDRLGNWTREWDQPEGATLYALWDSNMLAYDFTYGWVSKLSDAQLTSGDWVAYTPNEAKSLPTADNVPKTPGVRFVGWYTTDASNVMTELPAELAVGGKITLHAKYVYASTSTTWTHVYRAMNSNVEGAHAKPTWDSSAGRWNVADGTELAWVMYAKQNGTLGSGHDADILMTGNAALDGYEHSGSTSTKLLWESPTTYGNVLDGGGHSISNLYVSRSFATRSGGARYGESYYNEASSTGFVNHLNGSAQVRDVVFVNPSVYSKNTTDRGQTTYNTVGTVTGIMDGSVKLIRVGVEGGTVKADHAASCINPRAGGIAGTARGSSQLQDCYVRGTTVQTAGNLRASSYAATFTAGIAVLSESGAKATNCYFHGICTGRTSVALTMTGAILARKGMSGKGGSSADSGATVTNSYASTNASYNGTRGDDKCLKTLNSAGMQTDDFATVLNAERTPAVWSRDAARNAGLPTPFAALG